MKSHHSGQTRQQQEFKRQRDKKTHCPKNSKKETKVRIRRRFYLKRNRLVICEYQSCRTKITYELNQDVETEDLARKNEVGKIERRSFTSRE